MQVVTKNRVDILFICHSICALISGSLAFIFPHLFEFFMIHHGETLTLRDNDPADKVTHLVIRLYGALIIGQVHISLCSDLAVCWLI
jgi:hypothetical protein